MDKMFFTDIEAFQSLHLTSYLVILEYEVLKWGYKIEHLRMSGVLSFIYDINDKSRLLEVFSYEDC